LVTPLREVNEVGQTLEHASRLLTQRLRERDLAQAQLHALNIDLEGRVARRTDELSLANSRLVAEMTQREDAERRVREMQKMEAVGQLTGGIAHDFNNMMAVIISGLNLVQRRLARGETDVQRFIDGAMDGAQRAASLTQRLLAFARRQPLSPVPLDVNRLVASMSDLLRRSIVETIHIETVLAGGLWRSHTDPNQLENAILNLAINARDAMPGGGRLTIETSNAHLDEAYAASHAEVAPGQYVMIALTDTGIGMTPDIVERAFEPFFTTKPAGQGTGLGLSQVYGFIKQSKGHVKLYSEPGRGTTVKFYLPRFFEAGEAARPSRDTMAPLPTGTREAILVVEDEDQVRAFLVESLRELGYTVYPAENALQGLRLLDSHADVILLFTDVVMPEMDGRKLADEARRRRPGLKVLFTTGYTRNAIVHNGVLDVDVHLISKPFTLDQLAAKLHDVLQKP
jgi:signal transduction histidine kinase